MCTDEDAVVSGESTEAFPVDLHAVWTADRERASVGTRY